MKQSHQLSWANVGKEGRPGGKRVERRKHRRFCAACTLRLLLNSSEPMRELPTADASCGGFSFLAPAPMRVGDQFDCELVIPNGSPEPLVLQSRASVVCATRGEAGWFRLGCRIEDYSVLRATPQEILPVAANGVLSLQQSLW